MSILLTQMEPRIHQSTQTNHTEIARSQLLASHLHLHPARHRSIYRKKPGACAFALEDSKVCVISGSRLWRATRRCRRRHRQSFLCLLDRVQKRLRGLLHGTSVDTHRMKKMQTSVIVRRGGESRMVQYFPFGQH